MNQPTPARLRELKRNRGVRARPVQTRDALNTQTAALSIWEKTIQLVFRLRSPRGSLLSSREGAFAGSYTEIHHTERWFGSVLMQLQAAEASPQCDVHFVLV